MISSRLVVDAVAACGFDTIFSVPCSSIAGLLEDIRLDQRFCHIAATSEAEAVGLAAGAYLAGRNPIVIMQNSGFCDALNPLASLLDPFEIPLPFIVTGRGAFGVGDELQHRLIGRNFSKVAEAFELPFLTFPSQVSELTACFHKLRSAAEASKRGALLAVPMGAIENESRSGQRAPRKSKRSPHPARLFTPDASKSNPAVQRDGSLRRPADRLDVIRMLRTTLPNAIFVATTGYTGRELFAVGDRASNFYLAGSMGCASAVGLGLALFGADDVVVLDGDGAALMRLGNCATIGIHGDNRLIHVVLNNGMYASTGGQKSLGRRVDLAAIAAACGYALAVTAKDLCYAVDAICAFRSGGFVGPLFVDLWVDTDPAKPVPRPTIQPQAQTLRLRAHNSKRQSSTINIRNEIDKPQL